MSTRIVKTEKFIPAEGSPVYQVIEETTVNGQVIRLDPRNPTAEELTDADEQFAAAQSARIAELESEIERLQADHDPRMIDPRVWYGRFTRQEIIAIAKRGASDQTVQAIVANLDDSIALREADADYQMSLDHVNAIQGTGYLQSIGILTAERVAELLADSRPDEV